MSLHTEVRQLAAIKYDSKVWAASVVSSWVRESGELRGEETWRYLDRQLRAVAARRAALDAEELALIRKAIAIQIWRRLGITSMREYLEHVMGYGPQVAAERLRVSDALEGLPAMERALASNELSYSAVRELTRIATRKTEDAWLEAIRDSAKDRGDTTKERGGRSARAQIATVTKCEGCGQGWQLAAGRKIAITAAELERAECDAVHIGSLDGAPQRASSTIPPATERFVMHRDGGRCTVPGCRSAQHLEVHHIVHREHGGTNDPENLTVLCWGHHAAHHRGELLIEGKAPAITITRARQVPHVGDLEQPRARAPADRMDAEVSRAGGRVDRHEVPHVGELDSDARLALTTLGFKKTAATEAVAKARERVGPDASLETLVRAALRECPR